MVLVLSSKWRAWAEGERQRAAAARCDATRNTSDVILPGGRRRRVRRGDDSIDSAHHKTHRPSTIRGKCRQLVPSPRWMIGRQGSRGQCPSEVGLLLSGSLFLDDREAIE